MHRREALRLLAAGAVLPLTAPKLLALREARAVVDNSTGPRTLNAHQFATIKAMAEMILPKTDTPGAADVGATEFIDLILTEWYEDEDRGIFLQGLADVDTRSQELFGAGFVQCSVPQQIEILTELGEKMMEEAQTMENGVRLRRGAKQMPRGNFYVMLRRLTLTAYFTSEAGATSGLNFDMIPGRFDGCVQIAGVNSGKEGSNQR